LNHGWGPVSYEEYCRRISIGYPSTVKKAPYDVWYDKVGTTIQENLDGLGGSIEQLLFNTPEAIENINNAYESFQDNFLFKPTPYIIKDAFSNTYNEINEFIAADDNGKAEKIGKITGDTLYTIFSTYALREIPSGSKLGINGNIARTGESTPYTELFRKTANIGAFEGLSEPMQLRYVQKVANEAGIGLDGIKIKIIRDPELVGKGVCGYASPKGNVIELYPDAFTDTETLVKTIGHERTHIYQVKTFGPATNSSSLMDFEQGAWGSESSWWKFFNRKG
jgi:hypothetical protein